ncbi:MAG: hypothetical protein JXP34_21130 [Planctomycetes bacterium]|nr:hypothetical protein [Planctomycetota bacterium]
MCALLLAGTAGAQDISDTFKELDPGKWTLLGTAHHDEATWSVVLTDAVGNQVGGLLYAEKVSSEGLDVTFVAEISGGTGADGMALVLIDTGDVPPAALGAGGGGLGISDVPGPLFWVELDTYGADDDFEPGDAAGGNHIGVGFTAGVGDGGSPDTQADATVHVDGDLWGTGPITVHVTIEEGYVTVEIQNDQWMPDLTPIIEAEIAGWEGDFDGFLGFTGATGGATERHEVHSVKTGNPVYPCAQVERSFGVSRFVPETPFDVSLDVSDLCGNPDTCPLGAPTTVTIVELLPAGWTASAPSDGGAVGPSDVVTWTFTGGSLTPRTLTYKAASDAASKSGMFAGSVACSGFDWEDPVGGAATIRYEPPPATCPVEDEFFEFDDTSWMVLGNAYHDPARESVILTTAAADQVGGLFFLEPISTENLEITFTAQIDGGNSADGMSLVLVEGDTPPSVLTPPCGSCMGFSDWPGTIFHVELDTYGGADDFETNGATANHIGVGFTSVGGNAGSPVTQANATVVLPDDIRGVPLTVHVLLEDGIVTVEVQNDTWAFDPIVVIDHVEIENWMGDFDGILGFTAATGGSYDQHEVHDVRVCKINKRCPSGLAAACTGAGGVELSWNNGDVAPTSVQITRDGSVIADGAPADPPVFVDANPGLGPHTYALSFTMADGGTACTFDSPLSVEVFRNDDVTPWIPVDIGSASCGGIENTAGGFDVHGGGRDIGGASDGFRFVYQEYEGDFDFIARIETLDETHASAKAGLMARASLDANAPFACVFATPPVIGAGVDMSWRTAAGAAAASKGATGVMDLPVYLRLARVGANFFGAYSTDGATWTDHAVHVNAAMESTLLVGMAVTSHSTAEVTTGAFREVSLGPAALCPSEVQATCNGTNVVLTWKNNYPAVRIRIRRTDAAGTERLLASLTNNPETYTDASASALPAGVMSYRVLPVIGTTEITACGDCLAQVCVNWPACTTTSCPGCTTEVRFIRGDTDGNGTMTIGDGVQILERLFVNRPAFGSNCEKTGDPDDNGVLTIGDAVAIFNLLFASGADPKPPYPACGTDPTDDALPCDGPVAACP